MVFYHYTQLTYIELTQYDALGLATVAEDNGRLEQFEFEMRNYFFKTSVAVFTAGLLACSDDTPESGWDAGEHLNPGDMGAHANHDVDTSDVPQNSSDRSAPIAYRRGRSDNEVCWFLNQGEFLEEASNWESCFEGAEHRCFWNPQIYEWELVQTAEDCSDVRAADIAIQSLSVKTLNLHSERADGGPYCEREGSWKVQVEVSVANLGNTDTEVSCEARGYGPADLELNGQCGFFRCHEYARSETAVWDDDGSTWIRISPGVTHEFRVILELSFPCPAVFSVPCQTRRGEDMQPPPYYRTCESHVFDEATDSWIDNPEDCIGADHFRKYVAPPPFQRD